MSTEPTSGGQDTPTEMPVRVSHKSFRRKYRKIMVKFEETMRESTSLFKDEQRILDISQRLAEQNDQLTELLIDLNNHPQIPASLRYDIGQFEVGAEDGSNDVQHPLYDLSTAQTALREVRKEIRSRKLTLVDYRKLERNILSSPDFIPQQSYSSLLQVQRTKPSLKCQEFQPESASTGGTLTIQQEDQYLGSLDAYLNGTATTARSHGANNQGSRGGERMSERDKELQLRNPVSVYNWLRKHQPQVFLQDHEGHSEKPAKPAASRTSKRMSALLKQEQELYDDDGIAVDHGSLSKGKRKRHDDDAGYRPKGGNSRAAKKKKEEGLPPPPTKKGKKLSV